MTASENPPSPIAADLLAWYDIHARDLPWRARPGAPAPDPYRVWLSEIMLQQTTVAAVKPYFDAFTRAWPDVAALAAAPEEAVMAAWAGLGYYSRARNLVKAARAVARMGAFPDTEAGLRALPGVGEYTAAAIAAIAFGRRAVAIDANVVRVVTRLFAIDTPLPAAKREIARRADAITPDRRAGDMAQALMDLGSSICTTRGPRCLLCPIASHCAGRVRDPERFPVKPPKKAKPLRRGTCFWIGRGSTEVWLVERAGKGLLGGMRGLPDDGWSARSDGDGAPTVAGTWRSHGLVRHGFTHFDLELEVLERLGQPDIELPPGRWYPVADLAGAGLPTLFAKAAQRVLAARASD